MRVALLFYGFFRTFDYCHSSMRQFVCDPLHADVYVNSPVNIYAARDYEIPELYHLYSRNEQLTADRLIHFPPDKLKAAHLRNVDIRFYQQFVADNKLAERNSIGQYGWRIAAALHSMSLALETFRACIARTYTHYDLVILTRPDIRYYNTFDVGAIQLDKINFPANHMCAPDNSSVAHLDPEVRKQVNPRIRHGGAAVFGHPGHWFNDQIICGNQDNMLQLASVFDMMPTYFHQGEYLNSETYLGVHCMRNNISFVGTDFTTYELWRIDAPNY